MRFYPMEYYTMNDTTVYCPEWTRPERMDSMEVKDGSVEENPIRRFFSALLMIIPPIRTIRPGIPARLNQ